MCRDPIRLHPRNLLRRLVLLLSLAPGLLVASAAEARDLAVDPDTLLPVELATVGVDSQTGRPIALLRDPESADVVPIVIGTDQARAILMAMQEVDVPRPMTHDLMVNLMRDLDAELERVVVDGLEDGTYLGMLELRVPGEDEPRRIDARPSDALALAVRTGSSIAVAPEVLDADRPFDFQAPGDEEIVTALGITVIEAREDLREALGLPDDEAGVLVSRAESEAARAGLEQGALIVEVNGRTPETPIDFLEAVGATPDGEEAELRYWLDGETHDITLPTDVPVLPDSDDAIQA
ncbi:bifunctional nuclease domain-containing protein [Thioalkalivibrio sp. ALJ24]|uniref:bifunctional nuclease domain-containing protein n=1 Tax=Thioalkalivibrio sp. ALJ24 TaxID=545276 RepID=UPI00037DAD6C|nr:bifunctional nuclease domain-containing protein [Thioalkalivibrio sp. ALJ24]